MDLDSQQEGIVKLAAEQKDPEHNSKMMRFYSFIVITAVSLISSCQDSNVFDCEATLVTAENEVSISGEEMVLTGGPFIGGISDIQAVDSFLVIKASAKECPDFLYVYNTDNGRFAGSFLTKGRGENESITPIYGSTYLNTSGRQSLYLFDLSSGLSYGFDVNESVTDGTTQLLSLGRMPSSTLYANPIHDSLHFARYPQPDGIVGELIDGKGTVKKKISVYPSISGYDYFSNLSSADAVFTGSSTIAMAMLNLPQINILDISSGERRTYAVGKSYKHWKKIFTEGEQTMYYMGATATDRYLFTLYYGVPILDWVHGNFISHIHIFSKDGHFIYDITLSEKIEALTYDRASTCLYGADQDDRIYRYDLSELNL